MSAAQSLIGSLVEFDDYQDESDTYVTVENATFKEDFGPWSKGETVESLTLDYELGYVEGCNEGEPLKKCSVKLTVDNNRVKTTDNEE